MKKCGFTLLEVICVIAIVAILSAIILPVFRSAKERAKIGSSQSNLRQMYIALALYRTDHDGDARYGDLGDMGLPPTLYVLRNRFDTPLELWSSPCGDHPSRQPAVIDYLYWPGEGGDVFAATANAFQQNLIMFSDDNCNASDVALQNVYRKRRGLGVLLSGQLVNRFKEGLMSDPGWWSDPAP